MVLEELVRHLLSIQIWPLAEFDGAPGMKRQYKLHPNKTLAESDGAVHSKYQSTRHEMPNIRLATQFELSK